MDKCSTVCFETSNITNSNIGIYNYKQKHYVTKLSYLVSFRSFFKRRKGGRSSSRDPGGNGNGSGSKELASYSDVASLSYADNLQYQEENPPVNSYIRVERLDCKLISTLDHQNRGMNT